MEVRQAILTYPFADIADLSRFIGKIEVGEDGCWRYAGARNSDGYARFRLKVDGKWTMRLVHQVAYEWHTGNAAPARGAPDQLSITCNTRACTNPAHIKRVPALMNLSRGNGSRTECKRGHPFDDDNTYITKAGVRQCRACRRLRERGET